MKTSEENPALADALKHFYASVCHALLGRQTVEDVTERIYLAARTLGGSPSPRTETQSVRDEKARRDLIADLLRAEQERAELDLAAPEVSPFPRKILRADLTARSRWIDTVEYDPATHVLTVFITNEDAIEYRDMKEATFRAFVQSDSPGRYYNTRIRNRQKSSADQLIIEEVLR